MATFGIEVLEGHNSIKKFVKETNERLSKVHILNNPFTSDSKLLYRVWNDTQGTLAVHIKPIYPNFPLYAAFFLIPIVLIFKGLVWSGWHIPGLVFACLTIFWSKYFYYIMIRFGLRNADYKGKIKLLSQNEVVRRLISNGTN